MHDPDQPEHSHNTARRCAICEGSSASSVTIFAEPRCAQRSVPFTSSLAAPPIKNGCGKATHPDTKGERFATRSGSLERSMQMLVDITPFRPRKPPHEVRPGEWQDAVPAELLSAVL